MTEHFPLCAWTGVDENGETSVACDKRATSQIRDHGGHLTFACDEHLAFVEARAGSGDRSAAPRRRAPSSPDSPSVHIVWG